MPTASDGRGGSWCVCRVPPLQGGVGLVGPSSQGAALGCRVAAPLARMMVATQAEFCANGAKPISPGQRPGNSATPKVMGPERATLEQTIAGNVAEILEA